ncbi:reverse transcriptase domain-containing protein [Tanacetum coccineum]
MQESPLVLLTTGMEGKMSRLYPGPTSSPKNHTPTSYCEQTLNEAERNYSPLEKLALSLVNMTRRLRRYFEAHPCNNEYFQMSAKGPLPEIDDTETWTLYTDGQQFKRLKSRSYFNREPSGVEFAYAYEYYIEVKVDSKLVASQINGIYEASNDSMIKYLAKAREYISEFKTFSIENIPRGSNQKADVLSKLATVPFHNLTKEILVEVLNERSTEVQEVQAIVEEEGDNWMTPIVKYLEEGIVPSDSNEARALRAKIGHYTMESGVLFKKGYLIPMLRCVGPLQANYVIREIHMGSCGMHMGPRAVVRKAMRQGYYWPTMHADAKAEVDKCELSQSSRPDTKTSENIHDLHHGSVAFLSMGNGHTWSINSSQGWS